MGNIGRNAPCHCGSGKKYKNCHLVSDHEKDSKNKSYLVAGIIIAFIAIAALLIYSKSDSTTTTRTTTTTTAPPGEAPAGKVWSAEHGHWHDK
ncbi:MAG: SEC-C metal-binding domain-containing protein [Candidatus Cyclobacteriaceae bacterium M2_1C_046]